MVLSILKISESWVFYEEIVSARKSLNVYYVPLLLKSRLGKLESHSANRRGNYKLCQSQADQS